MTKQQHLDYLRKQIDAFLNLTLDNDNQEITQQYHVIYENLPSGEGTNELYWGLRGQPDYLALFDEEYVLKGKEKEKALTNLKGHIRKLKTSLASIQ